MREGQIHIGTSGWHYPHWVGPFYPENMLSADFLSFYANNFSTVEINNTFYQLPTPQTLADWLRRTPSTFRFTCKASRFITHMKKLKDPEQSTERFFKAITILGDKLGPVLFQLPPRWKADPLRLENFLKKLPKNFRYAFEFRDESWFEKSIYNLLIKHHSACCLSHIAGKYSPEVMTTDFVYIRLHGPRGPYQGKYRDATLEKWAQKCVSWAQSGKEVFCFFDNDEKGYAVANARKFIKLVCSFT